MKNIYSVRDSKAQAYLPFFESHNNGTAIRSFAAAANKAGHDFANYADDYTLFHIGTWDDENGTVTALKDGNINLGLAANYIEAQHPNNIPLKEVI